MRHHPGWLLAALLLGPGCSSERGAKAVPADGGASPAPPDAAPDGAAHAAREARVEELLRQLTLDEKFALMAGASLDRGLWVVPGVPRLGLEGFKMTDGPRGLGAPRLGADPTVRATAFPVGMARGATFDDDLEERVGEAIGSETRAWGGNVLLAPVINVLRHPAWGRAQETYGEDPLHLGRMGAAFVRGAQRHVIASAKHLAVNDIEDTRFTVNVTLDERTLREVFLEPFRVAVEAGVGSIMSAYNQVNGAYCSENTHLIHDILKGEWGFEGFVESDWLAAVRSTAPSVNAGLDIEMPFPKFLTAATLQAALDAGEITAEAIDDAVRRSIRAQVLLTERQEPAAPGVGVIGSVAHGELALEAARKSIVLLKNERAALPLDRAQLQTLAVIGTFAGIARLGDEGSSWVVPAHAVTPLEGLRARAPGVTLATIDADTLTAADRTTIAAADAAVVFVGLTSQDEGENINGSAGDRESLSLPAAHESLVKDVAARNPRTIVVVEAGSAVVMEAWKAVVQGIVLAWYPGQEGGNAIADVLYGDTNPSGKLPFTIPAAGSQLPPFDHTSTEVTYGLLHGYRFVDHAGGVPAFEFGFGLGYTTFSFENLALSATTLDRAGSLTVTVDVKNTGAVAGDEVVQLYVGAKSSAVERAPRELRGYARVHLAPGEVKAVRLPLRAKDLAHYDTSAGGWTVEAMEYTAWVGGSSRDLPVEATFQIR